MASYNDIPTYAVFLRDWVQEIRPEAITEEQRDKCSICWEAFGEPDAHGKLEKLVRLRKCGHIMGRRCLDEWCSLQNKTTCPVCRCKLYIRVSPRYVHYENPADRWAGEPLEYLSLYAEESAALRNQTINRLGYVALTIHTLKVKLFLNDRWPADFRVSPEDARGVHDSVDGAAVWLVSHHEHSFQVADLENFLMRAVAERLRVGMSNFGATSLDEPWAGLPAARVGPMTRRLTQVLIQSAIAAELHRIPEDYLVSLA